MRRGGARLNRIRIRTFWSPPHRVAPRRKFSSGEGVLADSHSQRSRFRVLQRAPCSVDCRSFSPISIPISFSSFISSFTPESRDPAIRKTENNEKTNNLRPTVYLAPSQPGYLLFWKKNNNKKSDPSRRCWLFYIRIPYSFIIVVSSFRPSAFRARILFTKTKLKPLGTSNPLPIH